MTSLFPERPIVGMKTLQSHTRAWEQSGNIAIHKADKYPSKYDVLFVASTSITLLGPAATQDVHSSCLL